MIYIDSCLHEKLDNMHRILKEQHFDTASAGEEWIALETDQLFSIGVLGIGLEQQMEQMLFH